METDKNEKFPNRTKRFNCYNLKFFKFIIRNRKAIHFALLKMNENTWQITKSFERIKC